MNISVTARPDQATLDHPRDWNTLLFECRPEQFKYIYHFRWKTGRCHRSSFLHHGSLTNAKSLFQVVAESPLSSDAPCSRRDLPGSEIPSEMQYVGVLIKSVFSDCELLKHAYLKPAWLIGCVRLSACLFVCGRTLFGNVRVRIAVIIRVNRSSVGKMLHGTNCWHI